MSRDENREGAASSWAKGEEGKGRGGGGEV